MARGNYLERHYSPMRQEVLRVFDLLLQDALASNCELTRDNVLALGAGHREGKAVGTVIYGNYGNRLFRWFPLPDVAHYARLAGTIERTYSLDYYKWHPGSTHINLFFDDLISHELAYALSGLGRLPMLEKAVHAAQRLPSPRALYLDMAAVRLPVAATAHELARALTLVEDYVRD